MNTVPKLIHYSSAQVNKVRSVEQKSASEMKPEGFWFSVEDGDGWKDWCESEGFRLDDFKVEHEVILVPDASILRLSSPQDIDTFSAKYKNIQESPYSYLQIDWRSVARRYQGIIIAPYQWARRLYQGCNWYYGWDCSSGCVWDAAAVKSITTQIGE